MVGGGMFMRLLPSPCPVTTKLCSGKDGEDIFFDGERVVEVSSETGKYELDHRRDDGFASVDPLDCWKDRCIIPVDIGVRVPFLWISCTIRMIPEGGQR